MFHGALSNFRTRRIEILRAPRPYPPRLEEYLHPQVGTRFCRHARLFDRVARKDMRTVALKSHSSNIVARTARLKRDPRCSQSAHRALFSHSKRGPSSTAGFASSYPSSTRVAVSASRLKARTSLSPSSPPASMSSALRPQARARSLTALCNQWTRKRWLAL